ncbi:hypothetical protein C4577_03800 [Candidatus Parcubacteria bacterium]|nr:MAG: hypothetical protein C4577_03800 [Candidatus Parcubacteria bacterium]
MTKTIRTDDANKMLRIIINGQSTFRQEVLGKIDKLDKKMDDLRTELKTDIKAIEQNLTERIDKVGKQLAYLEDDTPTREEFDRLTKRVDKMEQKVTSVSP